MMFSDVDIAKQGYITVRISPHTLESFLVKEMEGELEKAHNSWCEPDDASATLWQ